MSRCKNGSKQARKNAILYYEREAALAQLATNRETANRVLTDPSILEPDLQLSTATATTLAAAHALLGGLLGEADEAADEDEGKQESDSDEGEEESGDDCDCCCDSGPHRRDNHFGPGPSGAGAGGAGLLVA